MKTVLKKMPGTSASQFTVHCIIDVSSPTLKNLEAESWKSKFS